MRARFVPTLALISVIPIAHGAELGPLDGGMQKAFGLSLGIAVDESGIELDSTREIDIYRVVAPYPLGVNSVIVQLTAESRKVVRVKADGSTASPAACDKLVKDLRSRATKSLKLKFKKSEEFARAWMATSGPIERVLGCSDNIFHFILRDQSLVTLAGEELQALRPRLDCSAPAPSRPPFFTSDDLPSVVAPQYAPARKVEVSEYRAQLERIAARVRTHYEYYLRAAACEVGGRFQYVAVFNRRGQVVQIKLIDVDARSSAMLALAEREIESERFGAMEESGYRWVAFSLTMNSARDNSITGNR